MNTYPPADAPLLLQPLTLSGLTLRNRVVVSPMAMYSAHEGFVDDFHLVHLGRFALGGAGLVMSEATAVSRPGRITPGCAGLWLDAHISPWQRITDFIRRFGAAAGVQLGHSGWKGASQRPWEGGGALSDADRLARREEPWPVAGPSGDPFDVGWAAPQVLDEAALDGIVEDYRAAAQRAAAAKFDLVEVHCAHGYLLHSFLSPLVNRRDDSYGGSLENRMRFPLRVIEAVRHAWPKGRPLLVRISAVDGVDVGWSLGDSVVFAQELAARGVDAIDCSSGGLRVPRDRQVPAREPGFQVPFAARIRQDTGLPTIAVGLIREPAQAEAILREGGADLVALAREMLADPNWTASAAVVLDPPRGWSLWPDPFRWWLERRARLFASKDQATPRSSAAPDAPTERST